MSRLCQLWKATIGTRKLSSHTGNLQYKTCLTAQLRNPWKARVEAVLCQPITRHRLLKPAVLAWLKPGASQHLMMFWPSFSAASQELQPYHMHQLLSLQVLTLELNSRLSVELSSCPAETKPFSENVHVACGISFRNFRRQRFSIHDDTIIIHAKEQVKTQIVRALLTVVKVRWVYKTESEWACTPNMQHMVNIYAQCYVFMNLGSNLKFELQVHQGIHLGVLFCHLLPSPVINHHHSHQQSLQLLLTSLLQPRTERQAVLTPPLTRQVPPAVSLTHRQTAESTQELWLREVLRGVRKSFSS